MKKTEEVVFRVENWDQVTLAWLKSDAGAGDRNLIKASHSLLAACREFIAARTNQELHAAVQSAEAAIRQTEPVA